MRRGKSRASVNARTRDRRGFQAWRRGLRAWRRSRPFWGGLLAILGGVEIVLIPLAPLALVIHQGIAGVSSLLMGALMILMGLVLWFQPQLRTIAGVATVLFALTSFVTSNFGGFLLGMLLGIIGGSLGFAWAPRQTGPVRPGEPEPGRAEGDESPTPTAPPGPDSPTAPSRRPGGAPPPAASPADPAGGPHPSGEPDTHAPAVPGGDRSHGSPGPAEPAAATGTSSEPGSREPERPAGPADAASGESSEAGRRWPGMLAAVALPAAILLAPRTPAPDPESVGPTGPPAVTPTAAPTPLPAGTVSPKPTPSPTPSAVPGTAEPPAACDRAELPTRAPRPGTPAARRAAEAVAACLLPQPGERGPVSVRSAGAEPVPAVQQAVLRARSMTQLQVSYQGVVSLRTREGPVRALRFDIGTLRISGMEQSVPVGDKRLIVRNPGRTAELRGDVTLNVSWFRGKLFGVIPVTFTPDNPPPLPIPIPLLIFTDVEVHNVYVQADVLRLPTLREPVA